MSKPDFLENMFFLSGGANGCVASILLELNFFKPFRSDLMQIAVESVQRKYPALMISVEGSTKSFHSTDKAAEFNFKKYDRPASTILESELSTPIHEAPYPSWRFTTFSADRSPVALVLTIHHVLVDALSVQNFFQDILETYLHLYETGATPNVKVQTDKKFSYYLSKKIGQARGKLFLAKIMQTSIWVQKVAFPSIAAYFAGSIQPAPKENNTKVSCYCMHASELILAAKSQEIPLNSVITSAFAKAYQEVLNSPKPLRLMEAVDLRGQFSVPKEAFGVFVFSVSHSLKVVKKGLHTIAACHVKQLHKGRKLLFRQMPLIQHVLSTAFTTRLRKGLLKIHQGRGTDILLSNWGRVIIRSHADFQVSRLYFRAAYPEIGSHYQVGTVLIDDTLNFSLGYQEALLSKESADQLMKRAAEHLDRFACQKGS